jgi:hypothetical protein
MVIFIKNKKMTKIFFTTLLILTLIFISCGPTSKSALEYNDRIMGIVNLATLAQNNFFDQTDGHNLDSLIINQKHYAEASKKCVDDISKLAAFADNNDYLEAATRYVEKLNEMANNEAKEMVTIMTKASDDITEADISKVEQLVNKLDSKTKEASDDVEKAQRKFSEEWKFEINR